MPSGKSSGIYNAFSKYVDNGDKSLIEKFTLEELKFTLLQYNLDKGWPPYVAIEQRISELEKQGDIQKKEEKNMSITDEHIKKLTIPQLIKMLSLGAWIFILTSYALIFGLGYNIGYQRWLSQPSNNRQELSSGQLTGEQEALAVEIWRYQKSNNLDKVIISENGFIFDDIKKENTTINLADKVLGIRRMPLRFERLMLSIPATFLKMIPETRWGSPFVVSVPKEAQEILDRKL